jgi:L-alanine-DL-glutamate epimerase-like enolase superfamily enzyme
MRARGHRAFKLKVGFGDELDTRNLQALREAFGDDVLLAADANQAWDLERAVALSSRFEAYNLHWLEEPLRADRPWIEWKALSRSTILPLAAGENLAGMGAFAEALAHGGLKVVQPDAAKWGGVSGCYAVARMTAEAGCTYCPHYLGGGVGLLASAHLLAAAGGNGMLELDVNENPLRDEVCGPLQEIRDGHAMLTEGPGLGVAPDLRRLRRFQVREQAVSANLSGWRKLLDGFRFRRAGDRYEPSKHYMRGPGPKTRRGPASTL